MTNQDAKNRYAHVLAPLDVGPVHLKNRIVRTAHGTNFPRGTVNQRLIDYHEARAQGGIGLTILEPAGVHPSSPGALNTFAPDAAEGYRALVDCVAPYGMRVFQQLWHGGAHIDPRDGGPRWAPSSVPSIRDGVVPQAMELREIEELIDSYGQASRVCAEGGLDGVEVHAGHGYLVGQFLSPTTNRRRDDYGGDLTARSQLLLEILRRIRGVAPPGLALGVRVSASELTAGGLEPHEVGHVIEMIQAEELVDYVNLSVGSFYEPADMVGSLPRAAGYQLEHSNRIRRVSTTPNIVAGRVVTLDKAEELLQLPGVDLVSMVRATIADPYLIAKSLDGNAHRVRPCIGANQGCLGGLLGKRNRMGCTVNPDVGYEGRVSATLPEAPVRRVLVAGAGPAGLEAARLLAERGHDVTVHEASAVVGGALRLAYESAGSDDFERFIAWQVTELEGLDVPVRLDSVVDGEFLDAVNHDLVVDATGASRPETIVQRFRPTWSASPPDRNLVWWRDMLENPDVVPRGANVVVYDDRGSGEAAAVVLQLVDRNCDVQFATPHAVISSCLTPYYRQRAAARVVADCSTHLHVGAELSLVRPGRAEFSSRIDGARLSLDAEVVVIVASEVGESRVRRLAEARGLRSLAVGDCAAPRGLDAALADARRAVDAAATLLGAP